jgi:hypothetical protein
MTDILIRSCKVRVVRCGGWAWGPQPRALLDGLQAWFATMLSAELEATLAAVPDGEITAPLRLRVPVTLAQLAAWASREFDPSGSSLRPEAATEPLRLALHTAIGQQLDIACGACAVPQQVALETTEPHAAQPRAHGHLAEPLAVLVDWLRSGGIRFRLALFTPTALRAWHDRALVFPNAAPAPAQAPTTADVERLAGQAAQATADLAEADPVRAALTARLLVLATLEHAAPGAAQADMVRPVLERLLPLPGDAPPAAGTATGRSETSRPEPVPAEPIGPPTPAARRPLPSRGVQEWRVDSALPFLLLGPLASIGWLDALAASLAAECADDLLPFAGVVLAHKVLPPPGRGWWRSPGAAMAAAAVALLPEPPPGAALNTLRRVLVQHLSGLNAVVADDLCTGHRRGAPLLLTAAAGNLLLSDSDGLFPIAVAADVATLGPVLRRMPRDPVLVPVAAATPAVLAGLDALGARFATDAPPARGEPWQRLGPELWTNDPRLHPAGLADTLAAAADAAQSWQAVALDRPAVDAADRAFETSLGLAASLALGSMAWALWREREPVAPDLAIARFADLDGLVRLDAHAVTVSLPLGRRFFDLSKHGLLDDVPDVPWFGGHVLQFRSG